MDTVYYFLYAYGFLLACIFAVYHVAIQDVKERKNTVNLFQLIPGKPLHSALLLFGILCIAIYVMKYLLNILDTSILNVFAVLNFISAWSFLREIDFDTKFQRITTNRKLIYGYKIFICSFIGLGWFFFPSWVTYNAIALAVSYSFIKRMTVLKFRYLLPSLTAIFLYDIWGVYGSKIIPEIALEQTFLLPVLLLVPQIPLTLNMNFVGALGVGDIILPAFAIVTAESMGIKKWAMGAFALGLLCAFLIAKISQQPIPAMLMLSPFMLLGILCGSVKNKIPVAW